MSDFYFIASKLVGFFLDPLHILAVLVGLAALCHWLGRLRTLANTMLILWTALLGVTPLWNSLLFDLETQIKRSAPDQISGIILLGGAIDELTTEAHDDVYSTVCGRAHDGNARTHAVVSEYAGDFYRLF